MTRILLIVSIFFIVSCNNEGKKIATVQKDDPSAMIELGFDDWAGTHADSIFVVANATTYFDSIVYVPLQTGNDACIRSIVKIKPSQKYLFVQTKNGLLQFLPNGDYVRKIGMQGRGPGEHGMVFDFAICEKNKLIYILTNGKILQYEFTGKFLNKIPFIDLGFTPNYLALQDSNSIALNCDNIWGGANTKMVLINHKGEKIESYQNLSKFKDNGDRKMIFKNGEQRFYHYNGKLFHHEEYSDTVFTMRVNTLIPSRIIGLGKHKVPINHRLTYLKSLKRARKYNEKYFTFKIFETDRFVYLPTESYAGGSAIVKQLRLYDKKLSKMVFLLGTKDGKMTITGINDNLNGGVLFYPNCMSDDNNILLTWHDAHVFKKIVEEKHAYYSRMHSETTSKESNEKMREFSLNVKNNDNPIVVLAYLKK